MEEDGGESIKSGGWKQPCFLSNHDTNGLSCGQPMAGDDINIQSQTTKQVLAKPNKISIINVTTNVNFRSIN